MTDRLDLESFIATAVTGRRESLFRADLDANRKELEGRIAGRSVMVIGGAGTIGSEFIRAILPYAPARVFVVDTNENGLTELVRDLRSRADQPLPHELRTDPIDFGGRIFERLLRREGPFEIVASFAARKHVRSEKDVFSIEEMLETNVLKTRRLMQLLECQAVERIFSVSTDKAANPANVMGATKKLMEYVLLSRSRTQPVSTARFANVAFSNGSLPDGFLARLRKRQPLSTPSDVRRWFVSPAESGQLCLLAAILGRAGDVFFPRLGAGSLRTFHEIALALVREVGLEPELFADEEAARRRAATLGPTDRCWPVYSFPSDTSGEKPEEEFFTASENPDFTRFSSVGVLSGLPAPDAGELDRALAELERLFESPNVDKRQVVERIAELVPGFQHVERGKGLDQRM